MDNLKYTFLVSYDLDNSRGDIKIDAENPTIAEEDLPNIREEIRELSTTEIKGTIRITNIIPLPVKHSRI